MHLVKNVIAGEHHAFFLDADRRLIRGVSRHVDHLKGVIAHVQGHAVLESDNRCVGAIARKQRRLLRPEGGYARHVRLHIGIEDARAHTLMSNHRHIEKRVAGPMVAMRLSVDDVAQLAAFGDLGL